VKGLKLYKSEVPYLIEFLPGGLFDSVLYLVTL